MEPKFKTSFIPKNPISATPKKKKGGGFGIITIVVIILALGVIAFGVGVFLYEQLLTASIERKSNTLERARAAFEPTLIRELVRVDERLKASEEILDDHIALSSFFELLERLTLKSVRFETFEYVLVGDDRINITMSGKASNFSGVALQADIFGRDRTIKDPIFSGLNLDQEGNVVFDFAATVDKGLISFVNNLSSFSGRGAEPVKTQSVDTTATTTGSTQ
ncbi:MAG: hypothetical protein QF858_01980 [Candidatus Pacebacteria bacterium]|jgi:hypothetical protein|nr:hypothetical protein [bacterium]MDP6527627.1 hypothetical protein [Candidatus Paceibacterota bacterium]MDP6659454.1 hypothetical protein [Candidatus Paceibacterota bacterium]|tara:strand:- start:14055 stop:14717 length:663 start_codon:yes stop_codon:yes gene_type:complete